MNEYFQAGFLAVVKEANFQQPVMQMPQQQMQPQIQPKKKSNLLPGLAVGAGLLGAAYLGDRSYNGGKGMQWLKDTGQSLWSNLSNKPKPFVPNAVDADSLTGNAAAESYQKNIGQLHAGEQSTNPIQHDVSQLGVGVSGLGGAAHMLHNAPQSLWSAAEGAARAGDVGRGTTALANSANVAQGTANLATKYLPTASAAFSKAQPALRTAGKAFMPLAVAEGALNASSDNLGEFYGGADNPYQQATAKTLGSVGGGAAAALGNTSLPGALVYWGLRPTIETGQSAYDAGVAGQAAQHDAADVQKHLLQYYSNAIKDPRTRESAVGSLKKYMIDKGNLPLMESPEYQKQYPFNAGMLDKLKGYL